MKMSIAMLLMAGVIKVISGMDAGDVVIGLAVMEAFVLLFAEMAVANRIAGGNATKFGGTVLAMSASMLLLAGVIKIISAMEVADIVKGVAVMEAFVLLIAEMLVIAKAWEQHWKAGWDNIGNVRGYRNHGGCCSFTWLG